MIEFTIENGKYGKKLIVCSQMTDAIARRCASNDIRELELNWAKGFKAENISFVKNLTQLLSFEICDYTISSINEIHYLKNLKELSISTYCKTPLNLDSFENLETLSLFWRKGVTGLSNLKKIKKIFTYRYAPDSGDLREFSFLRTLQNLSLKTPLIESIGNVSGLENLCFLGIYAATKLNNIEGLENLKNLKHLELDTCTKIRKINVLSAISSLETLSISNCGRIESLKPVSELKALSELRFIESTNIIDGDIKIITRIPKLQKIIFRNRKHYNMRTDDLTSL
ncbi:MAG: Internalin-A precursor [Planctomycetes bacterium ADurb.Bin401]|nr:MAG: Internalin-A precursor [Planctomycetes bacterium ADurb.Bin401]